MTRPYRRFNAARDAEIRRLKAAGASLRELAVRFGLSKQRIAQIVNRGREMKGGAQ